MSVCPFCKAAVTQPFAPCPRCGKLASDHPSIAGVGGRTLTTDFDDEPAAALDVEMGSGVAGGGQHTGMAFEGGKGVTLDDDLFGDAEAGGPLELDVPDLPRAPTTPPSPAVAPPATAGSSRFAASPTAPVAPPPAADAPRGSAPELAPPMPPSARDEAAKRIANYPPSPHAIWQSPQYAVRVLLRQIELRQDLASLKRKRSPDVALYERALQAHDARMYKTGLTIACAALAVATLLFFMPVIKRFAFAD